MSWTTRLDLSWAASRQVKTHSLSRQFETRWISVIMVCSCIATYVHVYFAAMNVVSTIIKQRGVPFWETYWSLSVQFYHATTLRTFIGANLEPRVCVMLKYIVQNWRCLATAPLYIIWNKIVCVHSNVHYKYALSRLVYVLSWEVTPQACLVLTRIAQDTALLNRPINSSIFGQKVTCLAE